MEIETRKKKILDALKKNGATPRTGVMKLTGQQYYIVWVCLKELMEEGKIKKTFNWNGTRELYSINEEDKNVKQS